VAPPGVTCRARSEPGTFQRIGETDERPFAGKIVAATNRDLAEEMKSGTLASDDIGLAFVVESGILSSR